MEDQSTYTAPTGDDPLFEAVSLSMIAELKDAATHGERAATLLRYPLGFITRFMGEICVTCRAAGFRIGADYAEAVNAAIHATRMPNGDLPDARRAVLDGLTTMLQRFASAPTAETMRMIGAYDARAGRSPNPDHEGDLDYEAGYRAAKETTFTPEL